jgi:hypothetical protein
MYSNVLRGGKISNIITAFCFAPKKAALDLIDLA